jgi:hypothetical protein
MINGHLFEREQLLKDGEYDVLKIRKHWIVYVEDFFLHAFGCAVFMALAFFLASRGTFGLIEKDSVYGSMILIGMVLIFWTSFFYAWTNNYFDLWHVTNKEIIAINQKDILAREELFMKLDRIQDVFFERNGLIATVLGYGKLKVQSAGIDQEFVMDYVANVEDAAHKLMELRDGVQGKHA